MIFVTVGTQLTFDRLTRAVDKWAKDNTDNNVVIQSGVSDFKPEFCNVREYVEASQWEQLFNDADFIIAHAGMGTILKCLDAGKPLIVMPRRASLGEHRNDHQIATVSKFTDTPGILIVNDEGELFSAIKNIQSGDYNSGVKKTNNLEKLISEIRSFVNT